MAGNLTDAALMNHMVNPYSAKNCFEDVISMDTPEKLWLFRHHGIIQSFNQQNNTILSQ